MKHALHRLRACVQASRTSSSITKKRNTRFEGPRPYSFKSCSRGGGGVVLCGVVVWCGVVWCVVWCVCVCVSSKSSRGVTDEGSHYFTQWSVIYRSQNDFLTQTTKKHKLSGMKGGPGRKDEYILGSKKSSQV